MITQAELKEMFNYDPNEGVFRARFKRWTSAKNIGEVIGVTNRGVNPSVYIERRLYKVSHLAWLYVHGWLPTNQIDHINRNPSDNRISNLREATQSQNKANCRTYRNNRLGLKNIRLRGGQYEVRCSKDGKTHQFGKYPCLGQAVRAAAAARKELHADFATAGL